MGFDLLNWLSRHGSSVRFHLLLCVLEGSFLEFIGGIVSTILLLLGFRLSGDVTVNASIRPGHLLSVVGSTLRFFFETLNLLLGFLDVLLRG